MAIQSDVISDPCTLYGARCSVIECLLPMTSTIAAHKLRIISFFTSLLICSFSLNLSADTPQIRVSVHAIANPDSDAPSMIGALSREFRKLDGVLVTDKQPELKISCSVMRLAVAVGGESRTGYAASVAITDSNDHLIAHNVLIHNTIDELAHKIAVDTDGAVIEKKRRAPQPSSTP